MQLALFDAKLSKEAKRKAEKLMSRYNNIGAIIESKRIDLNTKMTVNYEASESQRSNQFHSETERLALLQAEIEEYERIKKKLDYVFRSLKPMQKQIWEQRYLMGRNDVDIYNDLHVEQRSYYRLKKEMITVVAEAFGLLSE